MRQRSHLEQEGYLTETLIELGRGKGDLCFRIPVGWSEARVGQEVGEWDP